MNGVTLDAKYALLQSHLAETDAQRGPDFKSRMHVHLNQILGHDIAEGKTRVDLEIVISESAKSSEQWQTVLDLCRDDMCEMMDKLQAWLDTRGEDHLLFRKGVYLLVGFVRTSGEFPPSFWLDGQVFDMEGTHKASGQAVVWRGNHSTHGPVMMKMLLDTHSSGTLALSMLAAKEALVWRQFHHERILPLLGIKNASTNGDGRIAMVSPLMHGHLGEHIKSQETLTSSERNKLLAEIAAELEYLHALKVTHGDVKAENILINDEGHVVLADFGLIAVGGKTLGALRTSLGLVTGCWAAPEHLSPATYDIEPKLAGDVYSFGHVILMLCTGHPPSIADLQIIAGKRPERPSPQECSLSVLPNRLWDIARECFRDAPEERPSMSEIRLKLNFIV